MKTLIFISFLLVARVAAIYEFSCVPAADCLVLDSITLAPPRIIPHPTICSNFYICDQSTNEYIEENLTCGEGFSFNGEQAIPGCNDEVCTSPVCTHAEASTCSTSCGELATGIGRIAKPGVCNGAWLCESFGMIDAPCADPGTFFNGTDCAEDEAAACCNNLCGIPTCNEERELMRLPDRSSCSHYYLCLNGDPLQQVCPTDEVFDLETNLCVSNLDVTCEEFCPPPVPYT